MKPNTRFLKRGRAPMKFWLISTVMSAFLLLGYWCILNPLLQNNAGTGSFVSNIWNPVMDGWFDASIEVTIIGLIVYNLFFCQQVYPERIATRRAYFESVLFGGGLFLVIASASIGIGFLIGILIVLALLDLALTMMVPPNTWLLEKGFWGDWKITKLN